MRSLLLLLVLAPALALAAPKKKKKAPPPPPPPITEPTPKVKENVSDTVMEFVTSATKVQAFKVADSGGLRPDPTRAIASDFVRGEAGGEVTGKELEAFRAVFFDEKSFRFDADVSKCRFVPHLSFQLLSGIGTLETVVSFSCNQVLFFLGKPGGRWVPQGTFDVKPARKKLLELARATFPKDPELQGLK